jgi:hypothetical protein
MWLGAVSAVSVAVIAGSVLTASAATTRLEAGLNGAKEVSPQGEQGVGDPNGRGSAVIRVNVADQRLCFDLSWRGIAPPSAAHVHKGDPGAAGAVAVGLFTTGDESVQGEQDLPDNIKQVSGCVRVVDEAVLRDIKNNPRDYYVNIHNDEFANGAIRGQLHH